MELEVWIVVFVVVFFEYCDVVLGGRGRIGIYENVLFEGSLFVWKFCRSLIMVVVCCRVVWCCDC